MSAGDWLLDAARAAFGERLRGFVPPEGTAARRWGALERHLGIDAHTLAEAVGAHIGVDAVDPAAVDAAVAAELPEDVARTHGVLLARTGPPAVLLTSDPTRQHVIDELGFALGRTLVTALASPGAIEARIDEVYSAGGGDDWGRVAVSDLAEKMVLRRTSGQAVEASTSATHRLFRELLRAGVDAGASDSHVQPYGEGSIVRNRVDGVLRRSVSLPKEVHDYLIRHVKAISDMDPTRHFVPQDGELRMELEHREIDLRLSIIPVDAGERLVVRYLYQNQARSLQALRLPATEQARLAELLGTTAGIILMTGPTGSGKSSLLYALLNGMNAPEVNIMSVEEPVEYRLPGASQINIDARTGLTFAAALRSILRQDPDVVMVGEIRDGETARIAAQAAMTGHTVLSTVHTLDALLSIARLVDLGVSQATLAEALQSVASQRLVRAICAGCRTPVMTPGVEDRRFLDIMGPTELMRGAGCEACDGTGYKGRLPVLEVIHISQEMRAHLRSGALDIERLEGLAAAAGMRFLAQCAAERIVAGETTVEEVVRVCGASVFTRLARYENLQRGVGPDADVHTGATA